jgi:hypothetical protein
MKALCLENEEVVGGYNDLPPNFEEITEEEFAQSQFFSYEPIKVEFRQCKGLKDDDYLQSVWIYWFSDYSYITIWSDFWAGKVHYGKGYLCKHKWKNMESRMCYTKDVCVLCGYIKEIDSSD